MANVFNWTDSRHIDVVYKPVLSNQIIATYGK